jgi:adenylosuccinate synthase
VVVGAQWGDEGKGKVVDYLAGSFDYIARVAGGHNAGHTVIIGKDRYVLQLIPCGILRPKQHAVIGTGTVVDPAALVGEIATLCKAGIEVKGRLHVSNRAHLIFPYHRELDKAAEGARGANKIGTTSRGIGPAYEDKMARTGLRFDDLMNSSAFKEKLERNVRDKNLYLKTILKAKPVNGREILSQLEKVRSRLKRYLCDTSIFLNEAITAGRRILFEGAHGVMLDIDHGTYPYVTSSNCGACAVFGGAGIGPGQLDAVLGISKAYTTRVGAGPFPTEISGALANVLREEGAEFGSATGRPRRIGWFDAVLARHAIRLNGMWGLALTKLDVLTGIDPIRICVGYKARGKEYSQVPSDRYLLEKVKPVYEEMPGWREDITHARSIAELPPSARRYLERIEEVSGVRLAMVGVGASRDATIVIENPFLA